MDRSFWKRAVFEVLRGALTVTLFNLLALALAAVFVRAYCPPQSVVTGINWGIKCVSVFLCCLLLIGRERAVFKGIAAGILSVFFTLAVFAAIGGVHLDGFFALELFVCALLGGAGALAGAKLRKA